jgi:hypothetical protein
MPAGGVPIVASPGCHPLLLISAMLLARDSFWCGFGWGNTFALRGAWFHGNTAQRLRASKRILHLFIDCFICLFGGLSPKWAPAMLDLRQDLVIGD